MRAQPLPDLFGRAVRRIHCVGVGGMGVGPLAIYLSQLGYAVSGEDDAMSAEMRPLLETAGVAVVKGSGRFSSGLLGPEKNRPDPFDFDLLIYSSAIPPAHPARASAAARGIPAVRRGEALAEVTRGRKLVAVCGSHGKTTTTAMLITALARAHFPAGWILGGLLRDGSAPARAGSNDWVVAEVDESDGTIGVFSPELTVAVNMDWDHPDFYRTAGDLEAAFESLFSRTAGAVLVSDACARSLQAASRAAPERRTTFGRTGDFTGMIDSEDAAGMTLRLGGRFLAPVEAASRRFFSEERGGTPLPLFRVRARGDFNAANAAAALAAAQLMGADLSGGSLADYPGVLRRQGILHDGGGITVMEDYAHHPAEIRALLSSLKGSGRFSFSPSGEKKNRPDPFRLIVVFQPHRFSRTAQFKAEFAAALALADRVHLLDVYGAGEQPVPGGTTADIYAELKKSAPAVPVSYLPGGGAEFFRTLSREVRPGDLVAFVGAGDIERQARLWVDKLKASAEAAARWDEFASELKAALSAESRVRREESLARRTTLGVGGAARLYAEPANAQDLQALLAAAGLRGIPVLALGRGSNLIVPDEGVDALVISLVHPAWARFEPLPDGRVRVGAGLRLKNLCGLAAKAGLPGFEFLEGIPGSVGGALRMNAGAMGGAMFDVVEEVEFMTWDGRLKTLKKADLGVGYRNCAELAEAIALGAVLRGGRTEVGGRKSDDDIARQSDSYRDKRRETQPREPSAGCIFKNPPGGSAGRLIDGSGLKGERVGGAEVSPVHANFIVNRGGATAADVLELIRRVRARVRQRHGVDLEPEVLLFGKPWRDAL